MLSPDGTPGQVSADRVSAAESAGYKQATQMYDHNGNAGWVANDRVDAAKQAGYQVGGRPGVFTGIYDNTIGGLKNLVSNDLNQNDDDQMQLSREMAARDAYKQQQYHKAAADFHKGMANGDLGSIIGAGKDLIDLFKTAPGSNDRNAADVMVSGAIQGAEDQYNKAKSHAANVVGLIANAAADAVNGDYESANNRLSQLPSEGSQAAAHGLAAALPVIGPAAADAGETFGQGNNQYAVGKSLGVLAPFGLDALRATGLPARAASAVGDVAKTAATNVASTAADAATNAIGNAASFVARKAGQAAPAVARAAGSVAAKVGVNFAGGVLDTLSDTVQSKLSDLKAGASASDVFQSLNDLKQQAVNTLTQAGVGASKAADAAQRIVSTIQDNYQGWDAARNVPEGEGSVGDSIRAALQPVVDELFPQNKGTKTAVAKAAEYYPEIANVATKPQMAGGGLQTVSDLMRKLDPTGLLGKAIQKKYDVPAQEFSNNLVGRMIGDIHDNNMGAEEASDYIQQQLAASGKAMLDTLRNHSLGVEDEQVSDLSKNYTALTESQLYQRLMKADPDIVGQRLIESQPEDFNKVMEYLDPESRDIARQVMVSKMAESAIDRKTGVIDFDELGAQVQGNKLKLGDQYPRIKATVDALQQMQEDAAKIKQKSPGWAIASAAFGGLMDVMLGGADPLHIAAGAAVTTFAPYLIGRGLMDYVMAPGGTAELSGLLKFVQQRVPSSANVATLQKKATSVLTKIGKQAAKYTQTKLDTARNTGGSTPLFGDYDSLSKLPADRPFSVNDAADVARFTGEPESVVQQKILKGDYVQTDDLLARKGAEAVQAGAPSKQINQQINTIIQLLGLRPNEDTIMHEGAHAAMGAKAGVIGTVNTAPHVLGEGPDAIPIQGGYKAQLPLMKSVGMAVNRDATINLAPMLAAGRAMDLMRGISPEMARIHAGTDMDLLRQTMQGDARSDYEVTDDHVERVFNAISPAIQKQLSSPGMQAKLENFSQLYRARYPGKINDAELKKIFTVLTMGVMLRQALGGSQSRATSATPNAN